MPMATATKPLVVIAMVMVVVLLGGERASGDITKDRAECQDALVGLSTCLTYIQEKAAMPTPDCCDGLAQVLASNKRCICILINDRDDPDLGFKFNATRALLLPAVCHHPSDSSECITLLGLAPHSQAAQIFEQFGAGNITAGSSGSSPAAARGASGSATAANSGGGWPLRVGGGGGLLVVANLLLAGLMI